MELESHAVGDAAHDVLQRVDVELLIDDAVVELERQLLVLGVAGRLCEEQLALLDVGDFFF